ncbi:MAG: Platelet-activating factor acetylhydrolase plasma/intracellular isoform II [Clostridia bacterium]|nr:Platelet-activating factor acetylhydrolase plasma/intracellular isoform II [Clostridia bacterium]
MRIFEILLVFACINLCLWSMVGMEKKFKLFTALIGINTLLFLVHMISEGLRWQLTFSYLLTLFFILIPLMKHLLKDKLPKFPKLVKIPLGVLSLIILVLTISSCVILPVFKLPVPSGPLTVGVTSKSFTDPVRDEPFTGDPGDRRRIMVQIFYPAEKLEGAKPEKYIPEIGTLGPYVSESSGFPKFILNHFNLVQSNSFKNASVSNAKPKYPLVLLSHGMGTSRRLHTIQAENLASQGFIVAAIDHTYSTTGTVFPDEKITGFKSEIPYDTLPYDKVQLEVERIGEIWTGDIKLVLDEFEKLNLGASEAMFKGRIDTSNIGIFGHSFGGAAAFNACFKESRIKAGIDMDGSLHGPALKTGLNKPFLFMLGEDHMGMRKNLPTYEEFKAQGISQEEFNKIIQAFKEENEAISKTVKNGGNLLYIKGTGHYNFTDAPLYSPILKYVKLAGPIQAERGIEIVNACVLEFFQKHLNGKPDLSIIKGSSKNYPEVLTETLK